MAERPRQPSTSQRQRSADRRRAIAAIVMIAIGLIALLSVVSYSRDDEAIVDGLRAIDVFIVPFHDVPGVAEIHNKLGLLGAFTADFLVNSTVGFASIAFPALFVVWGWFLLSRKEMGKLITFTNYAIITVILFATTFGIANLAFGGIGKEWSGLMGAFTGNLTTKLLGTIGASICIVTALFVSIILAIDLDIQKSLHRIQRVRESIAAWMNARRVARAAEVPEAFSDDVMINRSDEEVGMTELPPTAREDEGATEIEEVPDLLEDPEPHPTSVSPRQPVMTVHAVAAENNNGPEEPLLVPAVESELEEIDYVFPSVELLDASRQAESIPEDELKTNAALVQSKLANFGVEIEKVSVTPGPVVTLYELVPAEGVKISRIVSLADDLALALAAKGIRIMAPIPGKSAVGVEIPNRNPSIVHLRGVLNASKFRESKAMLPLAFGKTISGEVYIDDLAKLPHLLIAGSTGSGKSVGINTIIASLLFRLHPSDIKFVVIDPKKIELAQYGRLKHHFLAVSPDIDEEIITTPENAVSALRSVEVEMEKRYDRLAAAGVRNIADYNDRFKAGRLKDSPTITHRKMPYLIIIIDELADLMMTAAREVEEPIARLAQLARAVGIHLVLATQRPSVDVITGVIKANFPARIAFQVASKIDSRTILDMNGAEQLLGSGDMLYLPAGSPKPIRIQNAFISSDEVERLTDHIARQQGYSKPFHLPSILERKRAGMRSGQGERDEFFEEAARIIVRHQQGSVSLLQRRLKVGYSRAARLVDELEAAGIVGPFDGSKAREVLVETDDELNMILESIQ
jgi:S-DNA-T family DNA segregation ATPase FtsK/SpoIIIE